MAIILHMQAEAERAEERRRKEVRARLEAQARELGIRLPTRVAIDGLLTDYVERTVRDQLSRAWEASKVVVRIHSPGGFSRVGNAIARDLEGLERLGVPTESYADRYVASAAVSIYAACGRRHCAPAARFVVHSSAVPGDFSRWSPHALRRLASRLEGEDDAELTWLRSRGVRLPQRLLAEVKAGQDVVLNAREAFVYDLVHIVDGPLPSLIAGSKRSASHKS